MLALSHEGVFESGTTWGRIDLVDPLFGLVLRALLEIAQPEIMCLMHSLRFVLA
jgi:hypothetical protein